MAKGNNNNDNNTLFSTVVSEICLWANIAGANINFLKSAILHICRKHNCIIPNLTINSSRITHVDKLKILGIVFSKNFKWNNHVLHLKKSLMPRLNLIRYLAGRSYAHINTLTYLVKTLVLSKIDYGLFLYGNSPKTTLNIIKPSYHRAIKSSIYAFVTTPINNILSESGLPALEDRVHENRLRLIPKVLFQSNSIIDSDTRKALLCRNTPKVPSAIHNILNETHREAHHIRKHHIKKYPPWLFDSKTCNTELTKHKKDKTPNTLYLQIFNQQLSQFQTQNYEILYTDASKEEHNTAYAVVDSKGQTLSNYIMPSTASIFTAEAAGILDALQIRGKKL